MFTGISILTSRPTDNVHPPPSVCNAPARCLSVELFRRLRADYDDGVGSYPRGWRPFGFGFPRRRQKYTLLKYYRTVIRDRSSGWPSIRAKATQEVSFALRLRHSPWDGTRLGAVIPSSPTGLRHQLRGHRRSAHIAEHGRHFRRFAGILGDPHGGLVRATIGGRQLDLVRGERPGRHGHIFHPSDLQLDQLHFLLLQVKVAVG